MRLCKTYHKLPSELKDEPIDLLRMERLVALASQPEEG